jgi:hypothetical protein
MRFSVGIHTSLGMIKIDGWRFFERNNSIAAPSIPCGGYKLLPLVRMTRHQRSLLTKLARQFLVQLKNPPPKPVVQLDLELA